MARGVEHPFPRTARGLAPHAGPREWCEKPRTGGADGPSERRREEPASRDPVGRGSSSPAYANWGESQFSSKGPVGRAAALWAGGDRTGRRPSPPKARSAFGRLWTGGVLASPRESCPELAQERPRGRTEPRGGRRIVWRPSASESAASATQGRSLRASSSDHPACSEGYTSWGRLDHS